jgi:3-oxoacyl-[acyl-carrier-protein] synthase III
MVYTFPEIKQRTILKHCTIVATATAFPEKIVTNSQIIKDYKHDVSDIAVQKTFGVKERHVAEAGVVDTDLLCRAASACLMRAGIKPEQLSKLIVNKFVGDRSLPMTASLVQKKLNFSDAIQSFDVDGGANSFLQTLDLASSAINSGDGYVLIVSGGIINMLVDRADPRYAFLYGDGAGAVLLGPSDQKHIESSYFYSNYRYADLAVGFTHFNKVPSDIYEKKDFGALYNQYQTGNWKDAQQFILSACKTTAEKMLGVLELGLNDIDLFLITENNLRLWESIIAKLNIDKNKTVSVIHKYGNTMSAMLPVLLEEAYKEKRIKSGNRIMLLSVGEGISGGGLVYKV